jgi:hypothetical protein
LGFHITREHRVVGRELVAADRGSSRWISDVFEDHTPARELQGYEQRYANAEYREVLD